MLDFCLPHSLSTFSDIIRSYTLYLLYHCKADSNHFRSFSADAAATLLFCCVIRPRKINSKFNLFPLFRHEKKNAGRWRATVPLRLKADCTRARIAPRSRPPAGRKEAVSRKKGVPSFKIFGGRNLRAEFDCRARIYGSWS